MNVIIFEAPIISFIFLTAVQFTAGSGIFSLRLRVQTGPGTHPASYQMGTADFFSGDKASGA